MATRLAANRMPRERFRCGNIVYSIRILEPTLNRTISRVGIITTPIAIGAAVHVSSFKNRVYSAA